MTRPRARWAGAATLIGALSFATPAAASDDDTPASSGLRLGARSGFAVPAGMAFSGSGELADTITGLVPIRLDVGVRLGRYVYAGGLAQLAAIVPTACPGEMQCSGTDSRFGVMIGVHLLPSRVIDPWIGAGMGYEVLSVTRSTSSSRLELSARGLELLDLELGLDVRPAWRLRLGPVLSTSIGRYTTVALNGVRTRDFDTALHAWGMLGIRGAFDL